MPLTRDEMFGVLNVETTPTVATLRASPPKNPRDDAAILTLGYAAPNDGGGGNWIWNGDSTLTDDGGTVVKPSSIAPNDPGRWERVFHGPKNVLWFGAKPAANIAEFDNTAAFEKAASRPGALYIPEGFYPFAHTWYPGRDVQVEGAGEEKAILDFSQISGSGIDTDSFLALNACVFTSGSKTAILGFQQAFADDKMINLDSTDGIVAGDILVIYNPTDNSFSSARPEYRNGEFVKVHRVYSSTQLELTRPLYASYSVADGIRMYKINPTTTTFNNLTVTAAFGYTGIQVKYAYGITLSNVFVEKSNKRNFWLDRVFEVNVVACRALDMFDADDLGVTTPTLFDAGAGTQYGLLIGSSQRVTVLGGHYETGRHGVVTGSDTNENCVPCRDVHVIGAYCSSQNDIIFESLAGTPAIPVTRLSTGVTPQNQRISIDATHLVSPQTWSLNYGGSRTPNLSLVLGATSLDGTLELRPGIGTGNLITTGGPANVLPFTVEVAGSLAQTNIALFTATTGLSPIVAQPTVVITQLNPAIAAATEVQQLDLTALVANGAYSIFTLQYDGVSARNIPKTVNAATLQTYLENLSNIGAGNVVVTGTNPVFTLTFQNAMANRRVSLIRAGVSQTGTPYGASNHGNAEHCSWINCTLPSGISTGGDHIVISGCFISANQEHGTAILLGEMLGPNFHIDGNKIRQRINPTSASGLITASFPASCVRTGTLKITENHFNMGRYTANGSLYTLCIIVNLEAATGTTPVAQQDMNLVVEGNTFDTSLTAAQEVYGLMVYASTTIPSKGFSELSFKNNTCNGVGVFLSNNDPQYLEITNNLFARACAYAVRINPNTTSKYANSRQAVTNNRIYDSNWAGIFAQGAPTTPTDNKTLILEGNVVLNSAGIAVPTGIQNTGVYVRGYTDVRYVDNTIGDQRGTPLQASVDAFDYVTNLYEHDNTILGTLTTEVRGSAGTVAHRNLRKRGAASPSGVITAEKGSLFYRTDGGASTTLYVNETGTNTWRAI